jgi:hypothetical protein
MWHMHWNTAVARGEHSTMTCMHTGLFFCGKPTEIHFFNVLSHFYNEDNMANAEVK